MKIALFASHPIQYQAPFFKQLAAEPGIELMVYFNWKFGVGREQYDPGFGRKIVWDTPLLEGYRFALLKNFSLRPSSAHFLGEINPGAIGAILSRRYDAVVVYHWNYATSWMIFLTAFLTGTPVLLRGDNPLNQEFLKANAKLKIKKFVLGWLFRRVAAFLCVGEENRKFYEYYGAAPEKLFFAPHAVDNAAFMAAAASLAPRREELKRAAGVAPELPVILFVGKLIEKKRPMDLLRACAILYGASGTSSLSAALVFVGDGALRGELERYVKKNNIPHVRFAGFKNYSEVQEYYAIADVLVLPSEQGETWGLVVNEAMCFGVPIIVSDMVGCGPDLVRGNGYVFPLGDIKKLSEYLKDVLSDGAVRKKFGQRSVDRIKKYSYEEDIAGLRAALHHIASKYSPSVP